MWKDRDSMHQMTLSRRVRELLHFSIPFFQWGLGIRIPYMTVHATLLHYHAYPLFPNLVQIVRLIRLPRVISGIRSPSSPLGHDTKVRPELDRSNFPDYWEQGKSQDDKRLKEDSISMTVEAGAVVEVFHVAFFARSGVQRGRF